MPAGFRRWSTTPALALWLLAAAASGAAAQASPLPLPLHDPAYLVLEGLENSGCAAARVSPYKPYLVSRIREAMRRATNDAMCAPALVTALTERFGSPPDSAPSSERGSSTRSADGAGLPDTARFNLGASVTARAVALGRDVYRPLWLDLRPGSEGDPAVMGIARVRGRYAPTPQTVGVIEAYAQTHARNDPLVRARQLRSTTGVVGISEATFAGAFGPIVLSVGRDREVWYGQGTESLLLSGNAPPLDRIAASLKTGRFEARAIYAMLDDVLLDTLRGELPSGTPSQRFHRALAAHALTWRPSRSLEVSIGETILISRGSRTLELGYANPLMPYILTQHDAGAEGSEVRDNLLVYAGIRTWLGRTQLNGEVIVDDIQIDAADREFTPHQLGWRFQARQGWGTVRPGSLGVEYQRVDSYTYLRGLYTDVYQYIDRPLGSELGPDADRLEGSIELWPNGDLRLSTSAGIWRRGAQRLGRRPAVGAVGNAGQSFPSTTEDQPVAQRALVGRVGADVTRWQFPVRAEVEVARIENRNGVVASPITYLRAHLSATYAFRYP